MSANVGIGGTQRDPCARRKDVAFETVKSTCLGVGMCVSAATITDAVYSSWTARTLRMPEPHAVAELVNGRLSAAIVSIAAAVGLVSAVHHNRSLDERAKNSALSNPPDQGIRG